MRTLVKLNDMKMKTASLGLEELEAKPVLAVDEEREVLVPSAGLLQGHQQPRVQEILLLLDQFVAQVVQAVAAEAILARFQHVVSAMLSV